MSTSTQASTVEEGKPVQLVLNLASSELQQKIDAAIYDKELLAHQLEADSRERMRLQVGLKELALEHKRITRAALEAELEVKGLRQQVADAQAQAMQAAQAAQQQAALLQAHQQQLSQYQQGMLQPPHYPATHKAADSTHPPPFSMYLPHPTHAPHAATFGPGTQSNPDLTEGLFDDLDGLSGPHGSFCSLSGPSTSLFAPELLSYPFGPTYASGRKKRTSSTVSSPPRQDLSSAKPTVAVDLANLRHAAAAAQGLHTEDSARTARTEHTDTLADTAAETEGAGTEDTFSTTTVYPEAGDRELVVPPPPEVFPHPEAESHEWRTSMDYALSEVHSAMNHMYRTQSDEPLAARGLAASMASMNKLPMGKVSPSAPDLSGSDKEGAPSGIYLPMVGGREEGGTATPSLSPETELPLREQLQRLSTCNMSSTEDGRKSVPSSSRRQSVYGGSPRASTAGGEALPVPPSTTVPPDTLLSASQLLSSSANIPTEGQGGIELESAGSLAQGLAGVAGEALPEPDAVLPSVTEPTPPTTARHSIEGRPRSAPAQPLSESALLSKAAGLPPVSVSRADTPFSHCKSFTSHEQSDADFLSPSRLGIMSPNACGPISPGTSGVVPAGSSLLAPVEPPPLKGLLPPGPILIPPRRPGSTSLTTTSSVRDMPSFPTYQHPRTVRSGSVSPGAYYRLQGGGAAGNTSHAAGFGAYKVTSHHHGHLHATSQSKLDENLHLLQALEKITHERRSEIDQELEHLEHQDDDVLSHAKVLDDTPSASEARVQHLQAELANAKSEREEAMRTRHEVAVHMKSVLAQKDEDEAMRRRCRALLNDILGDAEERNAPPPVSQHGAVMSAPLSAPITVQHQQQFAGMQAMISQMEHLVGQLHSESQARENAAREERDVLERRLQAIESLVQERMKG